MGRRFSNPYIKKLRRSPADFIRWRLGHFDDLLPHVYPPEDFAYPILQREVNGNEPKLTWINHCTFLIECQGLHILTDPIWNGRCSPSPLIGPKREHPPAIELDNLPNIDVVVISHNHYDHLDQFTIKALVKRFPNIQFVVPIGVKGWFEKRGIYRVKELGWWEEKELDARLKVTGVPAQHNSGRGVFDFNKTLWMGVVMQFSANKYCYFVGDTAYNPYDFKKIGEKFKKIDLCLCPIGTYRPGRFMRTVHSSPEDAVNIHMDVGAKMSVAMHWKTFRLSEERIEEPPYQLYREMEKKGLNPSTFIPLEPGKEINW
jgi:N-acyl-phosphatidylethanolamine-hydrolysing phospholipase D